MARNWNDMNPSAWHTNGKQLDMLTGIEGDGYGTGDLLALAEENTAPDVRREAAALPWTVIETLFPYGDEQLDLSTA